MSGSENFDFLESPVPLEGRMPRLALVLAWSGVGSCFFFIVVGAALAQAYGTVQALIGIGLAMITFTIINQVIVQYAIKTGLNVSLFSLRLFGKAGAFLAPLILTATAIYYAVFEGSVMAQALHLYASSVSLPLASIFVVVLGIVFVSGSIQNWLDKINGILLPFYLIGIAAIITIAIERYGYSSHWLSLAPTDGAPAYGWWDCYTYYLGISVLMMYTFEYARFGRNQDSRFHSTVTFGLPFYAMGFLFSAIIGIFLVATIPDVKSSEIGVVISVVELMGVFGLLFVWVTQSRINTANFFVAMVNIEALAYHASGYKIKRIWAGLVVGILVYVLMQANIFGYLLQALIYQGIFVMAWVGVALSYIIKERRIKNVIGENQGSSFNNVVAWIIAVVVGLIFLRVNELKSFTTPVTFVVGFAAETLLNLGRKSNATPVR